MVNWRLEVELRWRCGRIVRITERVPFIFRIAINTVPVKTVAAVTATLGCTWDCFSSSLLLLFSSMKFCTILSKHIELGSNSAATIDTTITEPLKPSFWKCGSSSMTFSGAAVEFLRMLGNWKSKNFSTKTSPSASLSRSSLSHPAC